MPALTSSAQAFNGDTSVVDSTQRHAYGTRAKDANSNEYVYLKGITSTAAGSWVTFNPSTGVTALLAGNAVGLVAIAMAAVDANTKFGWYQIYGAYASSASDTVAGASLALYIDGTSGRVDDDDVAGDVVVGAFSTAADTTNVLPVYISYPFVTNIAID